MLMLLTPRRHPADHRSRGPPIDSRPCPPSYRNRLWREFWINPYLPSCEGEGAKRGMREASLMLLVPLSPLRISPSLPLPLLSSSSPCLLRERQKGWGRSQGQRERGKGRVRNREREKRGARGKGRGKSKRARERGEHDDAVEGRDG